MYSDTVNLFQSELLKDCPDEGKITKHDISVVIAATKTGDYTEAWKTKLYKLQSGAYCRLLEYIQCADSDVC